MSELKLTQQQNTAINARGSSILVSAGAGSGKTFVLVQRLLSRILDKDNPCNIDDFLIITYTRAAAADLKNKIRSELGKLIAAQPNNMHLQKQLQLIHTAKIGTTHSFCASLLRQWAGKLGIDPGFRIMDEDESNMLLSKLCSRLLDEKYEENDSVFFTLVDTLGSGRDDSKLAQSAIDLYKKLQSLPDPVQWMELKKEELLSPCEDPSSTAWGKSLMKRLADYAAHCAKLANDCLNSLFLAPDIQDKYAPALADDAAAFERIVKRYEEGVSWDEFSKYVLFDFTSMKAVRNASIPELKERIKAIRDAYKASWIADRAIFSVSASDVLSDNEGVNNTLCCMLDLCIELSKRFDEKKRSLSIMDYSDLEHRTLDLLSDDSTLAAMEVSSQFIEVLVDEYQDTNEIQDKIFSLISDNGSKLFMVGDVKQSIYRFRLAEPEIFLDKYSSFSDFEQAKIGEPIRIDLNSNFRSDPEVLSFVNRVFMNTMTSAVGGVNYSDRDALHAHNPPTGIGPAAIVNVIDSKGLVDEDGVSIARAEAEAIYTAKCIDDLIRNGTPDGKQIAASDIAILLRSDKTLGPMYAAALGKYGIKAETAHSEDPMSSAECSTLVCLLRIIDNPRQDIPLITVLHSPIGGFSPEDLAKMRVNHKDGSMYDALVNESVQDVKCADFMNMLTKLRALSRTLPCDELIWQIFCLTDIREIYGCMDNGEQRKANLDSIYDYACSCTQKGHNSLFLMLSDLEASIKKGFSLTGKASGNTNAVKIMSIHRSKGLEFPIVFVCDCARAFSNKDVEDSLLSHKRLGLAARLVDTQNMLSCDTAARFALKEEILAEQMSEEMRILYVALTRAKNLLYVNISSPYAQNAVKKAAMGVSRSEDAGSMADWLLTAALKDVREVPTPGTSFNGPDFVFRYISPDELFIPQTTVRISDKQDKSEADLEPLKAQLNDVLNWNYPYANSEYVPSKLTATQLKGRKADEEAAENAPAPPPRGGFDRPAFISRKKGLTPAEMGTALHLAMQYIDYSGCTDEESVRTEIARLLSFNQLTQEQAEAIPCHKIARFFESDIGKRLAQGGLTLREFKFSLLRPAGEFYPDAHEDDTILLQGVVDVCFEYNGELCVLDFKTDNITPGTEEERAKEYEGQIRTYGLALERILGKPVDKLLLYFFATDAFIEVKSE